MEETQTKNTIVQKFDEKKRCLLYFSNMSTDSLPHDPEELFHENLIVSCLFMVGEDSDGKLQVEVYETGTPIQIFIALSKVYNNEIYKASGVVYTVHQLSMLDRLTRWMMFFKTTHPEVAAELCPETKTPLVLRPTVDLVELYNAPAILSLSQRTRFSGRQLVKWLSVARNNYTKADEPEVLWNLCQRL